MRKATVAIDVAIVVLFVGIGRDAHDHGLSVVGMASTAWPFLTGLAAGWLVVVGGRRVATTLTGGVAVWLSTVTIGMVLRVVADQGIAFSFVLVALGFLGLTMLGWRAIGVGLRRLRSAGKISARAGPH